MTSSDSLLRNSLRGNAVFSTFCAAISIVAASSLTTSLGIPDSSVLVTLGLNLVGFAAILVWLSFRQRISPRLAWTVVAADLAWVVGTVPVVIVGQLTRLGVAAALAIAVVVAFFALLQALGIRRMMESPNRACDPAAR